MLIGSHLDSVLDGGAYDGPLGVVSSLAAIDMLRERGVVPSRPIVRRCLRRGGGVSLRDRLPRIPAGDRSDHPGTAARAARPGRRASSRRDGRRRPGTRAGPWRAWIERIGCFVELHVEQGRDLVDREAPVGLATGIWPHGRYRFDFTGDANHAGTTRMEDRHDPMLTYAMTALAANKQAGRSGQRATFGRMEVAPNGTNAIPSRVTAWLDARCAVRDRAGPSRGRDRAAGIRASGSRRDPGRVKAESVSGEVSFDAALTGRLRDGLADDGVRSR